MRNYVHVESGDVLSMKRSGVLGYCLRVCPTERPQEPELVLFFSESVREQLETLFRTLDQEPASDEELVVVADRLRKQGE